jgi:hypothetical protein
MSNNTSGTVPVTILQEPLQDRQSVGLRLGFGHVSGTRDQFFFLLEIIFKQLRVLFL